MPSPLLLAAVLPWMGQRVVLRVDEGGPSVLAVEPTSQAPGVDQPPLRAGPGFFVEAGSRRIWVADPRVRWGEGGMVRQPSGLAVIRVPPEVHELKIGGRFLPLPASSARGGVENAAVTTLRLAGPSENHPDLTILAEGYVAEREGVFLSDADRVLTYLATLDPWSRYLPLWNVHAVYFPSLESGADHPERVPPEEVSTALDCGYGVAGLDRLVSCDELSVIHLSASAPGDDVRLVIIDDPTYGGSGGAAYAVSYNGPDLPRAAAHELGHTAAGLADEYDYGYPSGAADMAWPNCAEDRESPPWQGWLDLDEAGVSTFLRCSYTDYYRPTYDGCTMNALQDHVCVVCAEQMVRRTHDLLASLLVDASPEGASLGAAWDEVVSFSVAALQPSGEPFLVRWLVDGHEIPAARGSPTFDLDVSALSEGEHGVQVAVDDDTPWVLSTPVPLVGSQRQWVLTVGPAPPPSELPGDGCASCAGGGGALLPLFLPGFRRRRPAAQPSSAGQSASDSIRRASFQQVQSSTPRAG